LVSIVFRQRVVGTHSINLTLFELQGLYRHIALHADSTVSDGGNINNYCAHNARESEKFHLSYGGTQSYIMYDILWTYQQCRMGYPSQPEKYTGGIINVSLLLINPVETGRWYFKGKFKSKFNYNSKFKNLKLCGKQVLQ